ncbi:MAG: 2,3-bisphosphoglycerate-independent phosphoglycerate mutase [Chloroflexi bacterium]|nr:2,3-bisphosphoglycerate-independent phosphoglycerate mutase [Chloroflexota bacterium]
MNVLFIVFDGLADRPAPELGGKTPLEAAQTPNLDRLAAAGINGMQHPLAPGYPLGSPLALHLMLGYPEEQFPDRGPLLAVARGLPLGYDDVALAARFASVRLEDGRLALVQRFIRGEEDACRTLAEALAEKGLDGLVFRYAYWREGDGTLFVHGGSSALSHEVTDSDPLGLDLPVLKVQPRAEARPPAPARRTADALNRYLAWAHHQLGDHPLAQEREQAGKLPINFIITKWAGRRTRYEPFADRSGMRAASLPDEEVVTGLMLELGFHVEALPEEPDPEADLRRRLARAKELLGQGFEFVHLHNKHPDPASHQSDPEAVVRSIEALDRAMTYYWQELATDANLLTVLTADHTTPSAWQHHPRRQFMDRHGGEPAPIVIAGSGVRVDDVTEFGERAAVRGGLGHLRGAELMPVVLNAAERANMYEMRPVPERRLYRPRPEQVEPFVPPD